MKKIFYRLILVMLGTFIVYACGSDDVENTQEPPKEDNAEIPEEDLEVWTGDIDISWYDPSLKTFQIYKPSQLAGLAKLVESGNSFKNKTILLTKNIQLNSNAVMAKVPTDKTENVNIWPGIGSSDNFFRGTFDGCSHYIKGMYGHGLFNYCRDATIKNLGIISSYICKGVLVPSMSYNSMGAVVSYMADAGIITECYNQSTITAIDEDIDTKIGGICGYIDLIVNSASTSFRNCYNTGTLTGKRYGAYGICGGQYKYGYGNEGKMIGIASHCYTTNGSLGSLEKASICFTQTTTRAAVAGLFNTDGLIITGDYKNRKLVDVLNEGLTSPVWVVKEGVNNNLPIFK